MDKVKGFEKKRIEITGIIITTLNGYKRWICNVSISESKSISYCKCDERSNNNHHENDFFLF